MNKKGIAGKAGWEKIFFSGMLIILILVLAFLLGCNAPGKDDNGLADISLEVVKERGQLIVGTSTSYPPMEFYDESGVLVGFDMDLAKIIASELGVEAVLVDYEWENLFSAIKNGSVDLAISSMTITPERQQEILFSIPYFNGGQVIMILKDNIMISSPQDLAAYAIGAQEGTTCEEGALLYVDTNSLIRFKDNVDEIEALVNGSLDAVVIDYVNAAHRVRTDSRFRIIGEPFAQEYYGISTKLGNDALMEKVNKVLRDMKRDGRIEGLLRQWIKAQ